MGTPSGPEDVPRPDSPWWLLGPFPVEQEPQGHTSGLHIWRPDVVLPHLPWAPAPGAVDTPAPPAPSLIPGDGMGRRLPGLQMVPRSRWLTQALGDRGCRARLEPGGLPGGGCLAGAFPSSDRWSRIRAVAPPRWRLDLVRGEHSAMQGQRQCPGLGWQGCSGTWWLCHW